MDNATVFPVIECPAPPMKKSHFGKVPVLDGLRAVAIILVLIAHAGLDKLVPGGLGVTIFFFLSGYLITSLMRSEIQETGTISISKFYIRRALRIFPPLYITLGICLGCTLLGLYPNYLQLKAVTAQFVHLANYTTLMGIDNDPNPDITYGIPNMPLWSLAVEEHFYLIFPVLYLLLARKLKPITQAAVLLLICGLVLGVRLWLSHALADYHEIYNWSHTRIDSILFGCILAVWSNPVMDEDERSYVPTALHFVIAIFVLLGCLAIRREEFRQTFRYSIQGTALLVVFSYLIRQKSGFFHKLLVNKPMMWIGRLSYSIYLINFFIFMAFPKTSSHSRQAIDAVAGFAMTFTYAWLMYALVERPLGRVRGRMH